MQIRTSNRFLQGMLVVLAASTVALGPLAMLNLYVLPYWVNVMWLDLVTYLHHHGPSSDEKMPWYRGQVHPLLRLRQQLLSHCARWVCEVQVVATGCACMVSDSAAVPPCSGEGLLRHLARVQNRPAVRMYTS